MPTSLSDNVKTKDTKLQRLNPEDVKARDTESKDNNAEQKNTSDLQSENRFDTQNLFGAYSGCNFWGPSHHQLTNTP